MSLLCATALLCLLAAVSQSAPPSCEDLLRPVDPERLDQLWGTWALVAGSLDHPASLEALKTRDSITMEFRPAGPVPRSRSRGNATAVSYVQANRFGDGCRYLPYNVSVVGGALSFEAGGRFNLTGYFLATSCPDCMLMRWDVSSSRRVSRDAYLLSRRRRVGGGEMEEYVAQLRCMGLPAPVVMDSEKALCPSGASTGPSVGKEGEKQDA